MARPVVTDAAERAYAALGPLRDPDPEHDWHLLLYVAATADLLQPVEDWGRDQPNGDPGWAVLLDPATAPDEALGWLGQFVGVRTVVGLDAAGQRIRITEAAGWQRGKPSAIRGAARQHLTGSRTTQLFERYQGDPYVLRLRTFLAETPDPAAVEAAVRALKPAGLILVYDVSEGQTYAELNGAYASYDAVMAAHATYDDVRYGIPPEV